jgi:hypothetical protein
MWQLVMLPVTVSLKRKKKSENSFIIQSFSKGTSSIVSYTPMTELDYGTLLCAATNKIGKQKFPCIFHIIAAGRWLGGCHDEFFTDFGEEGAIVFIIPSFHPTGHCLPNSSEI